ncbi:hypothetical protein [Streptomyces sp. NPDC001054]
MSARYELLHYIGSDDEEAQGFVDRFAAEVRREFAQEMADELSGCCAECDTCVEIMQRTAEPEGSAS